MATGAVDICNDALILCGCDKITALSDTTRTARLCNDQYERARDQLLVSHPWNFAMTRVELTELADLPSGWDTQTEFAYAFNLPNDCLRVWDIDDENEDWDVESGYLLANYTPVIVRYIKKVTNTAIFSKNFEQVLALDVALKIGYALTQSASFVQNLMSMREQAIRSARSFDAQEQSAQTLDVQDFSNSRL